MPAKNAVATTSTIAGMGQYLLLHWKHPEEDCIVFITCPVDGMENVGLYHGDVLWNNPLCMDMSGQGRWCFNHTNQEMWEVLDERPVQEEA